jgi:hypothetical protein
VAEPTPTPGPEEEEAAEATPEPTPTELPPEGETEAPPAEAPAHGEKPKAEAKGEAKVTGEGPSGKSDVNLPSVEIQGELEKPDIFFVLPRAKDQSDEQLMRARIKREITRPVIKDWVEEEMLLK